MGEEVSIPKDFWTRVREYVSDVRVEMKRVTWPGKQEIYGTTVMVVLTTFLFGIYFWLCDMAFLRTVSKIMKYFMGQG
jgi:preprotein translocase subunit SecE